jgi:hypothetical protein
MSFGGRDQIALTTPKVRKARKSSAASFEQDDLRGVISRGAEEDPQVNSYLSLMRASYIKSTEEFLKGA